MTFNFTIIGKSNHGFNNKMKKSYSTLRYCTCCGSVFDSKYSDVPDFCDLYCEEEHDRENNHWKFSEYEYKDISDWDADDHLAAWYDHTVEK